MSLPTIHPAALEIILRNEGFRPEAYRCPANVWTIGYGTTRINGRPVKRGDVIGRAVALALAIEQIRTTYRPPVVAAVGTDLSHEQLGACISLAYNIGTGAFAGSSVARHARAGKHASAAAAFAAWNKATVNGRRVILPGLVRRRKEEADLYRTTPGSYA